MAIPPQIISDHYDDPYHRGECENATHAAEGQCQETGCQLRFELRVADGNVHAAWFDGCGCVYCEALSSILAETIENCSTETWAALEQQEFFQAAGIQLDSTPHCFTLPLATLQSALLSPLQALDDDLADGTSFGGPSLREEC